MADKQLGEETSAFLRELQLSREAASASRSPSASGAELDPETRTLSTIIRAAMDMHDLDNINFDMAISNLRASENMRRRKIKVALINRQRRDIAPPDAPGSDLRNRTLSWESTHLTRTLTINDRAARQFQYSFENWCNEILSGIRQAADADANIISLGEFDYPPAFPPDLDDKSAAQHKAEFEADIKECIDSFNHPILLFAGSSHICEELPGTYRGSPVTELSAANVGNIFFNQKILDGMWKKSTHELVQKIYKRTPALKVGERLSRLDRIEYFSGFSTVIGRVAFLICADAYDPTIVFDIYAKSFVEERRPQIILVPAYNRSSKLARMCQALSLLTESVVMLLDVCAEVSVGEKQATEVWNCGEPGDTRGLLKLPDIAFADQGAIHLWDLDWDEVENFRRQHSASRSLRFFDSARRLAIPRERGSAA